MSTTKNNFFVTKGHTVHTTKRKILKEGRQARREDFRELSWKDLVASGKIKSEAQLREEAEAALALILPPIVEDEDDVHTAPDSVEILDTKSGILDPEKAPVIAKAQGTLNPKTPAGPWNEDPDSLADVLLEDLQLMVADRDRDGSVTIPETEEECITLLSRNFVESEAAKA